VAASQQALSGRLRQQYYERTWDAPSPAALNEAPNALWREFELAQPHILGALLDAAAHGVRMLPHVRLRRLPRMADFALWGTACESAFRPAGTLEIAYSKNRRDAIENMVDADPVAALVREMMADRAQWTGSASELLLAGTNVAGKSHDLEPVWLAKESPRTRWATAPGTDFPSHPRD
jgi:hypothetical protein